MKFKDMQIGQLFYINKEHIGSLIAIYVKRGDNSYSQSTIGNKSLFFISDTEIEVLQVVDFDNKPVILWVNQ